MSNDLNAPAGDERPRLGKAAVSARFVLIGVILAAVIGTYGYIGGWVMPKEPTPAQFADAFEAADGVHPGFRRNHAKGVGVSGYFESNGNGVRLSKASVFRPGRVPVIGRFSLGGGAPHVADTPDAVRGLGLQFSLPGGELWRTAMINLPVFPVSTPEAFYERLVASKPDPRTGKPDPARMDAFLARHPETARALSKIQAHPATSGIDDTTFYGLNAFRFINSAGESVPVRWLLKPFDTGRGTSATRDKNYLFEELIAQVHRDPLRWHLIVIVGRPGDPTNDPSIDWPPDREQVDVGTVTLDRVESEETSAAADINFDPLVLPGGIAPSDDPMLSARSAVYSQSFTRRAGEKKGPTAITAADVRQGD